MNINCQFCLVSVLFLFFLILTADCTKEKPGTQGILPAAQHCAHRSNEHCGIRRLLTWQRRGIPTQPEGMTKSASIRRTCGSTELLHLKRLAKGVYFPFKRCCVTSSKTKNIKIYKQDLRFLAVWVWV